MLCTNTHFAVLGLHFPFFFSIVDICLRCFLCGYTWLQFIGRVSSILWAEWRSHLNTVTQTPLLQIENSVGRVSAEGIGWWIEVMCHVSFTIDFVNIYRNHHIWQSNMKSSVLLLLLLLLLSFLFKIAAFYWPKDNNFCRLEFLVLFFY